MGGMRDDVDPVKGLPLTDEIVGKEEPLSSVHLHNPMGNRVAHIERPVLPNLHYSAIVTAARIVPK